MVMVQSILQLLLNGINICPCRFWPIQAFLRGNNLHIPEGTETFHIINWIDGNLYEQISKNLILYFVLYCLLYSIYCNAYLEEYTYKMYCKFDPLNISFDFWRPLSCLRKTTEFFRQDCRLSYRDSNRGPSEYEYTAEWISLPVGTICSQ
jgi:hypothetical protein